VKRRKHYVPPLEVEVVVQREVHEAEEQELPEVEMLGTITTIMAKTTMMMMMVVGQRTVVVELPPGGEDAELPRGEALEVGLVPELVATIGETAMVSWLTKKLTSKLMI
jgi:hypothetical protein